MALFVGDWARWTYTPPMRRLSPTAWRWQRLQPAALALATVFATLGCRGPARGEGPIAAEQVAPEYRADLNQMLSAHERDPSDPAVAAAADKLLDREPPDPVRAAALWAKAEQAYAVGDDLAAIAFAVDGLAREPEKKLEQALQDVRAQALVRGGDAEEAGRVLGSLAARWDAARIAGARAALAERAADPGDAALAYANWRAVLDADRAPADAAYALERFLVLSRGMSAQSLEKKAENATHADARVCLLERASVAEGEAAAAWTRACRTVPARVGVLLPRSGKLSALADSQLAALSVAVELLSDKRGAQVLFEDSGRSVPEGFRSLTARGADVIVGPIGSSAIREADGLAQGVPLYVPQESVAKAIGAGPGLEARVDAIAEAAGGSVIVLSPDNGYGRRALKGLSASVERRGFKVSKSIVYPSGQTSFAKLLSPVMGAAKGGTPVVILDAVSRADLVVRQLRRLGYDTSSGKILTTAEGLTTDALAAWTGVWIVPAAPRTDTGEFEARFLETQGRAPDDAAILVFRALAAAWSGSRTAPNAVVYQVEDGGLVPRG